MYVGARRTREIAVRIALGGTSRAVTQHFLRRAGSLIAIGLLAGTAAAFALARTYGKLVSDSNPMPLSSLALGIAALGSIALLASWLPLRSATRVEPSAILRAE